MINNNIRPIGSGIRYCLSAAFVGFSLSIITGSPIYTSLKALQGNSILLQGNGIVALNYNKSFIKHLTLALFKDKIYDGVLSQTNSGRAYRKKLAFYQSTARIAPQNNSIYLDTALKAYKNASRGQTLIKASNLPNDYDGMTSLNKIAGRRISGAAAICAESEPRHPILLSYGVTPTQKQIGAICLG